MAVYTKIHPSDLENIISPFEIEVVGFKPIDGGNANTNYQIQTRQGVYILTIAEERSFEKTLELANLLSWLAKHDFATSQVCKTKFGEIVTKFKGKPILFKKWISGKIHEDLNLEMLEQIGRSMAQLHQIQVPDYLPKFHAYGLSTFSKAFKKGIDLEYEFWLKERFKLLIQTIPESLPKGLIHGDLFFDNVLFENGKIKAIIDFEEACHYFLVFDIGMGIVGLCQKEGKIDLAKAGAFVKGYEKVRRLNRLEKEFLNFFIEYAAIATSLWRFWKYNIYSPNPKLRNKHREMVQIAKEIEMVKKDHFWSMVFERN